MSTKNSNSIAWSVVTEVSKNWRDGSIFRVVRFLNDQTELLKACNLKKGEITIDYLKALLPSYFMQDKKSGIVSSVSRVQFSYYPFVCAMRKKYGAIQTVQTVVITEKAKDKASDKKAA
jgi:hypothetical protein